MINRKSQNTWRLKNTLPNNTWGKKEISREIEKCFEIKEDENTTHQYIFMYAATVVLTGKFIVLTVYIGREEIFKINSLNFHFSKLDKEEQIINKRKKANKI